MADKAITDLNTIPGSVDDNNTWFAVAQSGTAYKVSGHEFVLALGTILDGHGGVKSIVYTDPVSPSLTGTMVITLADDSTTTVSITNGKGITSIAKTGTSDLVDTYTISYNDGTTSSFTVTNGAKGDTGDAWYVWIKYAGSQPTQDSDMGDTPDNWIGIYSGTSSTAPTHYTNYNWFEYKGEKGDTGAAASITQQGVTYQESASGTVAPSGSWVTNIPSVTPGNFLWTRTVLEFNDGTSVTSYSVSRYGIDGTGAVSTVNNVSPDGNGNVALTATNVPTSDNQSVQAHITAAESDITNLNAAFNNAEPDIVKEYHVGVGQEYTTLRAGIEAAVQRKNSRVIVHPGTYDLKTEFATELAQSSITEYTGNALYNGVHIIGMAGAIVTAIFTGSESNIWQIYTMFSPFFAVSTHDNNDYTIENIVIRANNTRYCVHDDPYGEGTYIHKYINCDMGYYNAMSPANYVACIGGGLGEHSVIVIEGGAYTSTTTVAMSGKTLESSQIPISFHNSSKSTAQSWIHIHGVELKNLGHFEFYKYGSSTEMSYVFLSNCRVGQATVLSSIDQNSANNMSVSEFNMTKKYGQALVTETVSVPVTAGNDYCYVGAKNGYNLISAIFAKSFTEIGDAIDGITWSGADYILFLRGAPSASETRQAILTWVKND